MSLLTAERPAEAHGLRYYQTEAVDAVFGRLKEDRSTMMVWATGLGKTVAFCDVAKRWPGKVLILAHRDELVNQARRALERATGEWVEIEQGMWRAGEQTRLVVGSVQTIYQEARLKRFGPEHFDLIIVDESHHATSPTYVKITEFFAKAKILGVTATPDRADEKAMGKVFDSVAHVMDIEDGIDAGYLVPIRGRRETLEQIDISGVSTSNGDLTIGQLDEVMVKAVEGIVHKTLELEPDRQAVCFFPGVQSAALACERFNARIPDSAIFIHGGTDPDERKSLVSRFKKKHFTYLCNCMIATEGFDCPDVSLIVLGRPTKSRSLYSQMVGRGTRVLPHVIDHIEGLEGAELRKQSIASSKKPDMMILDFVGNSGKHSLVGIEDILGGKYSEEEVELAKKKTGENPGVNPRDALAAARAQMQAMAKALRAQRVISSGEVFDPFKAFGLESDDREERYSRRFGFKPMTQPQRQSLINAGFLPNELENMDIRKASKAIAERFRRIDRGLASVKQLRKLREHGVLAEAGLSFVAASRGIDYIASECGWGRKKPVDPHRIHEILAARQPGEEG